MTWEAWLIVIGGAFLIGLAKGGLPGIGNLTVILFAMVFEPKASVGILLPVLMSADAVAIIVYRRDVRWNYIWKVLPWMIVGIGLGTYFFNRMSDDFVKNLIGFVVLSMTLLQIWMVTMKRYGKSNIADKMPHSLVYRAGLGITGGFATMVANAAGPIAQLYFLSVGLPKMAFIGTSVMCFFIINWIKVPLQIGIGIIHFDSIQISLSLMPVAICGALIAPRIVKHIPQRPFTILVWTFIIIAGLKLLLF